MGFRHRPMASHGLKRLLCQPSALLVCAVDFLWFFMTYAANTKVKRICLLATISTVFLWMLAGRNIKTVGHYTRWEPANMVRRKTNTAQYFVYSRDLELYMYSAIANYQYPVSGAINVVVTTMDASYSALQCCVILDNRTAFVTPAQPYFFYHGIDVFFIARIIEYFHPEIYNARQYTCTVPEIGQIASHVTLTSSLCSPDIKDYLPIQYPQKVPGGLAVCAKIAHSGGLDPEKVIEWFEVQRILGVDKVLMFDMGNPESLNRVLRYYQDLGILDLHPYELPGLPRNRSLAERSKRTRQFGPDESMAVLECRQRMAGYSYVMSHDVDEFIVPRRNISLKQFFKEKMEIYQDSAGFYFDAEFFIYNWGPTNPEDDLMLTRYRKATKPHWECTKYVYLPGRVLSSTTHTIYPFSPYTTYKIESDEAVLHHYRRCPDDVWPTCFPETIIDHVMTRYPDLHARVVKVREATNTSPNWNAAN